MTNTDETWHGSNGTVMTFVKGEDEDKKEFDSSRRINCFCECYPEFCEPFFWGGGLL